jgi:hypothetical protein
MHAVRNTFVEVGQMRDSLASAELHILSDSIAYAGKSNRHALVV